MRQGLLLAFVALGASVVAGARAQPAAPAAAAPAGAPAGQNVAIKQLPSAALQKAFEFDEDAESAQAARARMARHNEKLKPILAADPRFKPLVAQIQEALRLPDPAARKARLGALSSQILAVRNDAIAKLKPDANEVQTDLAPLKQRWKPRPPAPALPKKETLVVSQWPIPMGGKANCPDDGDAWDFDGSLVKIKASSTPVDKDCGMINAGRRTAIFDVPEGANRVDLAATAKMELHTTAVHIGFYAKALNHWGFKILSPEGITLSTVKIAGVTVPLPVAACKIGSSDAESSWPNPIPFDFGDYTADLQEGDANNACSFNLPPGIKKLSVVMFVGGRVDADVLGLASQTGEITPKSVKATFFRP